MLEFLTGQVTIDGLTGSAVIFLVIVWLLILGSAGVTLKMLLSKPKKENDKNEK